MLQTFDYIRAMDSGPLIIKICGLTSAEALDAALSAGVDMVGFVFFAPSPRHLDFEKARELARRVEGRARKVALTVDAEDAALEDVVEALRPDMLQLHGGENPERVASIRSRFGLPVMKAIGVARLADLAVLQSYAGVADAILFDAKPSPDASRPGGNGRSFDWRILSSVKLDRPWLLSGGLTCDNVGEALAQSGAPGLDVSSGVERAPGVKDKDLIARFVAAARSVKDAALVFKD